jgi:mannonate dehydratase
MIEIAEILQPQPTPLWKLAKQVGVDHVVGVLDFSAPGPDKAWDYAPLLRLKQRYEEGGFTLSVIESTPPVNKIQMNLPGRDEQVEWFKTLVVNMGRLGVPVLCYNWMPILGVPRTSASTPLRGGARAISYDHELMRNAPPAGHITEGELWDNLHSFLREVLPVAEKAGVKLAMHPDDPPVPEIRGISRILRTVDAYDRLVDMIPSSSNAITMCQGNFTLMTDDLPATIRHFGAREKIAFVHFRDVQGTPEKYVEVFHDEGKTDMLACLQAYKDIDFNGVLRPDHVPAMEGDEPAYGHYSAVGSLFAIGYIKGLRQAVYAH